MNKGGVGSIFSGIASKFGRASEALKKFGTLTGTSGETLSKITGTLDKWAETINSYNSIGDLFSSCTNSSSYTRMAYDYISQTSVELADLTNSIMPDVAECLSNGATSSASICENGILSLRDCQDLIDL